MSISVNAAIELIANAPPEDVIILASPPGFGKSAAAAEAAARQKWAYWPLYAGTKEAVEIQGLPNLYERDGKRYGTWSPFDGVFPLEGEAHSGTILVNIDDLGHAAPSVVKAVIRCVYGDGSQRTMGNHPLYHDLRIVGTTNLHTHRAGAARFETYVSNRITLVEIEPNVSEWCTWALAHGVNPIIVAYVSWGKSLTDFAPEKDSFMSPRSLTKLGRFVDSLGKAGINGATLREVACGTIGKEAGMSFLAYSALAEELPDMDAVLAGKQVTMPTRPEVQYMFATTLARAASEKHTSIVAKVIGDLTAAHGFEVAAFLTFECLKGSAEQLRGLRSQPALYKWLAEYGKYLP